jgi:pimeloyl-ACP methyl ester carboxylesterase
MSKPGTRARDPLTRTANPVIDAASDAIERGDEAVLPPALEGEHLSIASNAGRIHVYVAGRGRPLLLIHSVNAAASAAEVQPLHDYFRRSRQVFSIDLPGFGLSDRSDRRYTPQLMTDAIHAVVAEIRSRHDAPVDALALSLSCEFLARAAVATPRAFRSLALVSPTGFSGGRALRKPPGTTRGSPLLYWLLRRPGWGPAIFRFLTRPSMIRRFLRGTWGSTDIDEWLWRYDTLTARQPGAELAPLYFISGQLFSADIHRVYQQLALPIWSSHGVRGHFTDYRQERIVKMRWNWRFSVFPTGAFPHFEICQEFCREYDKFLGWTPLNLVQLRRGA